MTPDVTIKISFEPEAATTEGMQTTTAPPPLPLDDLAVSASTGAPAPQAPEELSAGLVKTAAGDPPGPMEISALLSTAASAAPQPEPLGSLGSVGGPPTPLSPEELGGAAAAGDDVPEPDSDELESSPPKRASRQKK